MRPGGAETLDRLLAVPAPPAAITRGIPVDAKRDRRRLPHLLTERDADGELVLRRRADGAYIHLGNGAARFMISGLFAAASIAAPSLRWELSSTARPATRRPAGSLRANRSVRGPRTIIPAGRIVAVRSSFCRC